MDGEVHNEVPVLKAVIARCKNWETVQDQLLLRKVAGFLLACPRYTEAEKADFANEHWIDSKKAK